MKKHLLFFYTVTLFCVSPFSQSTIPNSGFENWYYPIGNGGYEDPNDWYSSSNVMGVLFSSFTVNKSIEAHSGSYAAQVETKEGQFLFSEDTIKGVLILGNLGKGVPFTARPTKMKCYYKGGPLNDDTSYVAVHLKKWNTQNNTSETIGAADTSIVTNVNHYSLLELPISYLSNENPDSILIVVISSNTVVPIPGSVLYMDDISFEIPGAGIDKTIAYHSSISPNPVKDELKINIEGTEINSIVIFDPLGRKIDEILFVEPKNIDVSHISAGIYSYQLKNKQTLVSSGKFVVQK